MSLLRNDPNFNKRLIEILDEIIEKGHWEDTLFLQVTGKKLREFRERLKNELELPSAVQSLESTHPHAHLSKQQTAQNHRVFILLYCSEGNNLKQWENVINSLESHSMTRPIYKNETDIQTVIRNKSNKQNDAYIALNISENDISPHFTTKISVDRYGNELIVLREGAIKLENIAHFMHISGYYIFQDGKLIHIDNSIF